MAAEARVGSAEAVERFGGAVERFGGAGMALLPWTKHMLVVLWDQLRLLVQVIYYTFMSVFQMFRFEVHVRITDDPSVTPDPTDPFLFSSLFSEDAATDHTEALLSSLRGEELCCDAEGGVYIGHKLPSSWAVGDWNIFVSSSEARCSDEERSGASCWSSEEEHSLEFDCDESKALWESLSRSNDPYDPFCFSACISTRSKALWETQSMRQRETSCATSAPGSGLQGEAKSKASWEMAPAAGRPATAGRGACASCDQETQSEESWETESKSISTNPTEDESRVPPVGRFWESSSSECSDAEEDSGPTQRKSLVCRSDSDSSWSSENSENGSETSEQREENDLLWDLFTNNNDPFNPMCFSATNRSQEEEHDADEKLWSGLSKDQDPYHPLNFTVLQKNQRNQREELRRDEAREEEEQQRSEGAGSNIRRRRRGVKPELTQRNVPKHTHPQVFFRPWTRTSASDGRPEASSASDGRPEASSASDGRPEASSASDGRPEASSASDGRPERRRTKKVRFSDQVQVHVMRAWLFARQASRRGQWEESARDRERFKRRIVETEKILGLCLSPEHRERVRTRVRASETCWA